MIVTDASNNQIRQWKKLQMGKYRKKEGLFLAEGARCVEQIVENGFVDVREILVDHNRAGEFGFVPGNIPVYRLYTDDFNSISDTESPQGIIAVCEIPEEPSLNQIFKKPGLIAAFDAIQDPGNLGTMIRSASWFGVTALISGTGTADPWHPKVVRSTAGATGALPMLTGNLSELLPEFENNGWQTYLLDLNPKAEDLHHIDVPEKAIFIVGNEANGIHHSLKTVQRKSVFIPGNSKSVESLNAAVAFGIALYGFSKNQD